MQTLIALPEMDCNRVPNPAFVKKGIINQDPGMVPGWGNPDCFGYPVPRASRFGFALDMSGARDPTP